jgi:hypothetical protein
MSSSALERLASYHPIISCEGAAEEIVIGKLIEADVLVFPSSNLVGITRLRKATRIQEKYLNYDYDWPVCILRVLDSPREKFSLRKLYRDRFKVYSIYTRPEIEILIIIREDNWDSWKRSGIKPSEYCTQVMHISQVKNAGFLDGYWDAESLIFAALEYRRLSNRKRDELCLADIIKAER